MPKSLPELDASLKALQIPSNHGILIDSLLKSNGLRILRRIAEIDGARDVFYVYAVYYESVDD
jgi:hypothetical protein